jgi:hypothetical protein
VLLLNRLRSVGFVALLVASTGLGCPERLAWRAGSTVNLVAPVDTACFRSAIVRDSSNRALVHSPQSVTFTRLPDTLQAWHQGNTGDPFISIGRTWPRELKPSKTMSKEVEQKAQAVLTSIIRECGATQRGRIENWDR